MLTTTPFLRPRDGCVPMPITLSAPSGAISATMAAIFDVPMSSPTIRFFSFTIRPPPSLGIFRCASGSRFPHRLFAIARNHHCRLPIRSAELRQLAVPIRAEYVAARVDERRLVPTRKRFMLGHVDLEPPRPLAAQCDASHPWHLR